MEYDSSCSVCRGLGYLDHFEYCTCDAGQFYEASDTLVAVAMDLNRLNGYMSEEDSDVCDESTDMNNIFYLVYLPYNMTEYEGKEF